MRLNKLVISAAALAVVSSGLFAGTSNMDVEKVFERECQGCHGPNHEGGVGSDLRPKVTAKKNAYELASTILNGRAGTAMPEFKEKFKLVSRLFDISDVRNSSHAQKSSYS